MARRAGARVTGLGSEIEYLQSLGVDHAIDVASVLVEREAGEVDAIIDTVGARVHQASFAVLKPGGILVSSVSPPDAEEAARHGVKAEFILVNVTTPYLVRIAELFEAGVLSPRIGVVLPLSAAREAHEMLEGQRPRPAGKIVLEAGSEARPLD
jgi:NADPH:quinone reductase-like Zn-dependent oxidoreductase